MFKAIVVAALIAAVFTSFGAQANAISSEETACLDNLRSASWNAGVQIERDINDGILNKQKHVFAVRIDATVAINEAFYKCWAAAK